MNWRKFEGDLLYSQMLTYWYEEWKLISNEVESGMIGINVVNIRVILLDLINEYELNQFESENNRKVYIKLIDTILSKNYINIIREELLILKEKLEKKETRAIFVISKELSELISKQSFSLILFDELFLLFEKKYFTKKNRIKIRQLTREIIVDLVTSGRNIEDVNKLVSDAFASYFIHDKDIFFEYKGIPEDINTDEERKDYIDRLSIRNRLDYFREKLVSTMEEFIFIYPIWGMVTVFNENEIVSLFGCILYNPEIENVLEEEEKFDEFFDTSRYEEPSEKSDPVNFSRCNAKILVSATSLKSASKVAESKFFNLLNLLNLYYARNHHEFFWDGQFIGKKVDDGFSSITSLLGKIEDKQIRRNISKKEPRHLSEKKYGDIKRVSEVTEELKNRGMFYEANSILSVIEIMSQAKWQNEQNKLTNYWIAIESLANISKKEGENKFHFIKEAISNMYFLWEQYNPLHKLFRLTEIYSRHSYNRDSTVNIPHDFLREVGIYDSRSEDSVVYLKTFYNRMDELQAFTTKDSFLDEIEDTIEFYESNDKISKRLKEKRNEVKLTIDYIYKCRNQIVHNGYVDKNLIPYLVNFSEAYASSLFTRIMEVYSKGEFNLQNYFTKEIYDGYLLEKKLSKGFDYKLDLDG